MLCPGIERDLAIVIDVNNDSRVDLILVCTEDDTIIILLGNGDGTFQTPVAPLFTHTRHIVDIHVENINNDTRLDLVLVYENFVVNVIPMLGNDNGTSQTQYRQLISANYHISDSILADVNQDNQFDIILADSGEYIYIYFGDGTGEFSLKSKLFLGRKDTSC